MSEQPPPNPTVDLAVEHGLDAALAAAFETDSGPSSARGPVPRGPGATAPGLPRVQLRASESGPGSPVVLPDSEEMPGPSDRAGRYRLVGEIARGGMGAVLMGRDADLGRDIAVKVL